MENISKTSHMPAEILDTVPQAGWRDAAACQDQGNKLFFPVGVGGPAEIQIKQAKGVCEYCPSQAQCLNFAITTNQEYGVWGGTSEEERRVLRRQWRQQQRALAPKKKIV